MAILITKRVYAMIQGHQIAFLSLFLPFSCIKTNKFHLKRARWEKLMRLGSKVDCVSGFYDLFIWEIILGISSFSYSNFMSFYLLSSSITARLLSRSLSFLIISWTFLPLSSFSLRTWKLIFFTFFFSPLETSKKLLIILRYNEVVCNEDKL